MSLRRREQLVSLARAHNALIITDDVYDRLQWPTTAETSEPPKSPKKALLPRLTDIDRNLPPHPTDPRHFGHTVSNGSFSKILGPGLRTGWADATPTFAYGLSQCGSSRSGGCPSQLVATMITEVLKNGDLQEHISSVLIPSYARRWAKMMSAIEEYLVPLGISVSKVSLSGKDVFGGYFIWFELPEGMSAARVATRAKEDQNLIVAHGNLFEVYGDEDAVKFHRWIRVCFSWEDEEILEEGIRRLAEVVKNISKSSLQDRQENATSAESLRTPMGSI
jgi:DNA-binding transcriptional MocR family regulator